MNTTVSSVAPVPTPLPTRTKAQAADVAPHAQPSAGDRLVPSAPSAPLLTVGAAALAQLIPGTVEAEGVLAIGATIVTAARATLASPAARLGVSAVAGAAGGYVSSLARDAFAGQPIVAAIARQGHAADAALRAGLGIPPHESP